MAGARKTPLRRGMGRSSSLLLLALLSALLVAADFFSKQAILGLLSWGGSMPFLPGVAEFRLTFNGGAAFGLLEGAGVVFLIIAAVAVLAIVVYTAARPPHSLLEMVSLSLICAGAIGNAVDRAPDGLVTDFINLLFVDFAVFNVADACLTCGVVLMLATLLLRMRSEKPAARPQGR
jgi:signal peptidase II